MAASGGTNVHARLSTPVDTQIYDAASDLRKRVAIPKIPNILSKPEAESTCSLPSLLENSAADHSSEFEQYQGPPIGYSSAEIVHENGYNEIVGTLFAPRPHFGTIKCSRKVCGHCFRVVIDDSSTTRARQLASAKRIEPELESAVDSDFDSLPPWIPKPEPVTPSSLHPLHHFNWTRFPHHRPLLSGLFPLLPPRAPPHTPEHYHNRHQSASLSATAPTFIPSSTLSTTAPPSVPNTPNAAYLKAQLLAREAAAKAVIAAAAAATTTQKHNNVIAPPTPSSSISKTTTIIPTGPAHSTYGSRFNHSTGSVFGPRTIDLRSSAQRLNDRRIRARVVSGAPPTAPAAMREAAAAAAAVAANLGSVGSSASPSPSLRMHEGGSAGGGGGAFAANTNSNLVLPVSGSGEGEGEGWPRLGDGDCAGVGVGGTNGKNTRSKKYKEKLKLKAKDQENGNATLGTGTGRLEFWMR